jgi:hypothetical protein
MTAESQLDHDLGVISNSLRMLPSWQDGDWWQQFSPRTDGALAEVPQRKAGLDHDRLAGSQLS